MAKYQVTYESQGWKSQVVSDPLEFQEANQLAAGLQADAFKQDGHDLKDGQYAVQPVTDKQQ